MDDSIRRPGDSTEDLALVVDDDNNDENVAGTDRWTSPTSAPLQRILAKGVVKFVIGVLSQTICPPRWAATQARHHRFTPAPAH